VICNKKKLQVKIALKKVKKVPFLVENLEIFGHFEYCHFLTWKSYCHYNCDDNFCDKINTISKVMETFFLIFSPEVFLYNDS